MSVYYLDTSSAALKLLIEEKEAYSQHPSKAL